jgi:predicted DNA-binding transcriptional regulator AlpA
VQKREQRTAMTKYLRYRDLDPVKGIPFTRQHIKRLQKARTEDGKPRFPLSVPFGDNTEVFIDEEIDQWTADRIAERDAKAAALAAQLQQEDENT